MKIIRLIIVLTVAAFMGVKAYSFVITPELRPETTLQSSPYAAALVTAARSQIGVTLIYDGSYQAMSYPMGDIDRSRGVCSDVIIRAFRDAHDLDLQQRINRDMKANFGKYPKIWGLSRTDRNIDHRRVPNLRTYLKRHGASIPVSQTATDYQPGDLVTWMLRPGTPHIGIVSDQIDANTANPLILHNIGFGTRLTDMLFKYEITGHYRPENGQF